MNHKDAEIAQFLVWFSKLEEIPLETRRDFLSHILTVGELDDKSINFISTTLQNSENISNKRLEELETELASLSEQLLKEENPTESFSQKIYKTAEKYIKGFAKNFKSKFKFEESKALKVEENLEKTSDISEVEKLKAGLM